MRKHEKKTDCGSQRERKKLSGCSLIMNTVSLDRTVQELLFKTKIAFCEDNGGVQGRLSLIQRLELERN